MKALLIIVALGIGLFYGYQHFQNPADINDPVYVEIRMDMEVGSRKLTMALFGRSADEKDCRDRSERVWKKVIEGCRDCTFQVMDCKRELEPRYARLFDNEVIASTYLSFTRGSRGERDGRMVFWGLNAAEGDSVCDAAREFFKQRYSGEVRCVRGHLR